MRCKPIVGNEKRRLGNVNAGGSYRLDTWNAMLDYITVASAISGVRLAMAGGAAVLASGSTVSAIIVGVGIGLGASAAFAAVGLIAAVYLGGTFSGSSRTLRSMRRSLNGYITVLSIIGGDLSSRGKSILIYWANESMVSGDIVCSMDVDHGFIGDLPELEMPNLGEDLRNGADENNTYHLGVKYGNLDNSPKIRANDSPVHNNNDSGTRELRELFIDYNESSEPRDYPDGNKYSNYV